MARPTKAAVKKKLASLNQKAKKAWDPLAALYEDQQKVFLDPTPDRVLTGTRQLGKSTLAAVELVDVGLKKPGSESVFLDFDITHAEKILLRDFERLLEEYDIPAKLVNGELQFENGSVVYIFSGKPAEIDKLQGLKMALLVCDESNDAAALEAILTMCRPALMRFSGRVLLLGIPGRVRGVGYWWSVTEGDKRHLYGQHRGHMDRNPYLPRESRERQVATARAELGEDSPDFQRHWLGIWPANDNALRCFRYNPAINGFDGVAPLFKFHSLGLDPGGVLDAEAVVVIGHGNGDGLIYVVDEDVSAKKEGGDWDVTGERIGPMEIKWRPEHRYLDYGSAKKSGVIVQYRKDQLITLDAVPDKNPEQEFGRINRLFQARRLFVRRGSKLEKDLLLTTWDQTELANGRFKQDKGLHKQNSVDALRAAMWGVEGYVEPKKIARQESEIEREARRIMELRNSKPKPPTANTDLVSKLFGTKTQSLAGALGVPPPSRSSKPPSYF